MVRQIFDILPIGCVSEPVVHFGSDIADQDEFEVRVYGSEQGRTLVAAIELVSPANKDRPDNRRAFVAKIAAVLQKGVGVSVVDFVTLRQFNLYADLLELIGGTDPQLGPTPPHLYSVTIRSRKQPQKRSLLDMWFYPMTLGEPLPTLLVLCHNQKVGSERSRIPHVPHPHAEVAADKIGRFWQTWQVADTFRTC